MATPYVDLLTILDPVTGGVITAAWADQIRENFEALIDPPACSIYNSTSQTVTTGTDTILAANTENYDNDSMHSTVSQTSRITIQKAGRYLLNANCTFDVNGNGIRKVEFFLNGTTAIHGMLINATASPFATDLQATRTHTFAVGEYVECRVYQSAGANNAVTLREFAALFLTRA